MARSTVEAAAVGHFARESNDERSSTAFGRYELDITAVCSDDLLRDEQTQAKAAGLTHEPVLGGYSFEFRR